MLGKGEHFAENPLCHAQSQSSRDDVATILQFFAQCQTRFLNLDFV